MIGVISSNKWIPITSASRGMAVGGFWGGVLLAAIEMSQISRQSPNTVFMSVWGGGAGRGA